MSRLLFTRSLLSAAATALLLSGCGGGQSDDATDSTASGAQDLPTMKAQAVSIGLAKTVVINEVMASNFFGATDEDGDVEDWVELTNTTAAAVDLSGWGLSNKPASPFRWVFPAGTSVPARGHLRVWLSKKDRTASRTNLHANFNLDNGADELLLSAPNATVTGVTMDQVALPLTRADVSLCRLPSGTAGAAFQHCTTPTPAAANSGAGFATMLAKPALSVAPGIYAGTQVVTVTGPAGAQLRYTLDGSEPTAASTLVAAPITIGASSTLRVAAFSANAVTSPVETATYVIDPSGRFNGQRALFVSMSPADMANYKSGGRPAKGWAAHAAMTSPTGALMFNAPVQGSDSGQIGSRNGQNNIPLDLKFKDALGTKSITAAGLFSAKPATTGFKHLKLRNGGDDYWYAHLRDQFWQDVLDHKLSPGAASEPVHVFTNGQYYGMMDFREKEDETLAEATYGVDKDNVQYLNDTKVLSGTNTTADYTAARNFITQNPMAVAANYERAKALIDVESFAQYFALHMFAADRDWLWRNMHRFRMPDYDGRWRWRPHDLDISSGGSNAWGFVTTVSTDMNNNYGNYDAGAIMNALLANPSFRGLYISVIADQLNTTLSAPALTAKLDAMAAASRPYMQVHWANFPNAVRGGSFAQWTTSVAGMRSFLTQREGFYDTHTRNRFALSARKSLTVSVSDSSMGTVKVNTIDLGTRLTATAPSWTGRYYPEVPVTLEARPKPGFVFVGWQGSSSATSPAISTSVATDGLAYRAVFAPAGTVAAPTVTAIPAQAALTGDLVSLDVPAGDAQGLKLTWSAKKLPSGLNIHPDTGRIYGKPTKGGAFASTVTVSNGKTSTTINLAWQINNRGDRVATLPQDVVGDGNGLVGTYFNNATLSGTPALTRNGLPAVALGAGAGPVAGFGTSNWGIRWDGYLESPVAGAHVLRAVVNGDDAVRVYVGGTLVIDNWTQPSTVARQSGTVTLAANAKTPIRVEFKDPSGSANLQMLWQLPGSAAATAMPLAVFSTAP